MERNCSILRRMDTKIKQDEEIHIGENIRKIRKAKGIKQTELVRMLQLEGIMIYRETLVKIERGKQHVPASLLKAIKNCLQTSYDELLR